MTDRQLTITMRCGTTRRGVADTPEEPTPECPDNPERWSGSRDLNPGPLRPERKARYQAAPLPDGQ